MSSTRFLSAQRSARLIFRQRAVNSALFPTSTSTTCTPPLIPTSTPSPSFSPSTFFSSSTASPLLPSAALLRFQSGYSTNSTTTSTPTNSTNSSSSSSSSSNVEDAPDSDEDFKPQYRKPEEASPIHQLIEKDVKENPVMVYMKGVPAAPMCGFSNGVVQLLKAYGVAFKSRNVLEDEELRNGIKTYSQWPTIPQVFVNGEFVGGCDILFKMHESGELDGLFESVKSKPAEHSH